MTDPSFFDAMGSTSYGRAAFAKLAPLPANFQLYIAELVGPPTGPSTGMRVTGRVFREAKRGPNKGKLVIPVPGTIQTVVVSREEMNAMRPAASSHAGG